MQSFSERYTAAVQSGFQQIPQSLEMERLYGECDHFIGHQPGAKTQLWNSEVIVEGRYELTMQVETRISDRFDRVLSVCSEPQFYVCEIERVDILPDGRAKASYSDNQKQFGLKEWQKVVSADGDLSAAGIKFVREKPVKHVAEYQRQVSAPRVSVRPSASDNESAVQ
jgi:hypothetical protein